MVLYWRLMSTMTFVFHFYIYILLPSLPDSLCEANAAISLGTELIRPFVPRKITITLANKPLVLTPTGINAVSQVIKREANCSSMPRLYRTRVDVPVVLSLVLQLLLHVSRTSPQVDPVRLDPSYRLTLYSCGIITQTTTTLCEKYSCHSCVAKLKPH